MTVQPAGPTPEQVIQAVLADLPRHRGVVVDSPPGAGKSTLVVRAAAHIAETGEPLMIVAQTNEQVDDLVARLATEHPRLTVGPAVGERLRAAGPDAGAARRHRRHRASRTWAIPTS